jgi:hypothetical protein
MSSLLCCKSTNGFFISFSNFLLAIICVVFHSHTVVFKKIKHMKKKNKKRFFFLSTLCLYFRNRVHDSIRTTPKLPTVGASPDSSFVPFHLFSPKKTQSRPKTHTCLMLRQETSKRKTHYFYSTITYLQRDHSRGFITSYHISYTHTHTQTNKQHHIP